MRYRRAGRRYHDSVGAVAASFAAREAEKQFLPPYLLGRLGGEMAGRMVQAGLAYLTERAVGRTRASFRREALAGRSTRERTDPEPKA